MKTFIYKAKHGPGKTVTGEVVADSKASAIEDLDSRGYVPINVEEKDFRAPGISGSVVPRWISDRDITVFTRQLGSLTKSGVPILKALSTISEQSDNTSLSKTVSDIEASVMDGKMLSEALTPYPKLFSELYISMVRAGESAGILDTILFRLADAREKAEDTRRKVQAAIAYPVLVVSVGFATVAILLTYFLPKVVNLFDSYTNLPLATRILIKTSTFFEDYWIWMLLVFLLCVAVFKRIAALEKGKLFVDRIKLHLPLLRHFALKADISRFSSTLALLVECGIPIDKAIELSSNTMTNSVLKDEMDTVRVNTVQNGIPFSAGLKKTLHFPVMMANLTAVGEEAGKMEETLTEVADFYDKELEQYSKVATSLLEPILILVIGLIVGFIVAAMLLPVFDLSTGF
jgi:type II secretory pathway component PulF